LVLVLYAHLRFFTRSLHIFTYLYATRKASVKKAPYIYGSLRKGGFPLSRTCNFYVRTDVNFNWLYMRK